MNVPEIRLKGFTEPWVQCKLRDVADIVGGGTPDTKTPEYWGDEIDWYSPAEIGEQIYVSGSQRKITSLGLKKSSATILPVGTVLFTSRAGIGNTAILDKVGATNQGFQSIVPKKGKLDSYFIFSRTHELKRYGQSVGAGTTFIEVTGKQMAEMPLLIPTLPEQIAIGEFFRALDENITLNKQKLDGLKQLKKGYIQQMFPQTGETLPRVRFEGFTEPWQWHELRNVANFFNEKRVPIDSRLRTSGEYPYYGATGIIDYVHDYIFDGEYVLLAEDGANIITRSYPIAYLTKGKFWLNNHAHIMAMKSGDNGFLLQVLEKQCYKNLNTGTAQPKLNGEVVKKMTLLFPGKEEQTAIGNFFRNLDNQITTQTQKVKELKQLKVAYLQKMFV